MKKLFAIFAVLTMIFAFSGTALADGHYFDEFGNPVKAKAMVKDVNANAEIGQVFEADDREYKDMPRGYANGTEVHYPGMPSYFGPAEPNANTMDLRTILLMKKTWNRETLKATGTKAKTNTRARFFEPTRDRLGMDESDADTIDIILGAPPKDARLAGVIMVRVRDTKATTLEAMADAGRHALDIPGATMYIVAFASNKVVKSGGWGIGFHTSAATANGTNDISTVTSGGTGWSTGEAGYEDKPWVHAYVVVE